MKKTISFLLLILLFSCSRKINSEENYNLILAGKIENFQDKSIQIISNEFFKSSAYVAKIKDDGTFQTMIPIYHYHDLALIVDNQLITLLNKPSDSVYVHSISTDSTVFSGDNSKTNSDIQLLSKKYYNLYLAGQFYQKDENYKAVDFLKFIEDFNYKSDSSLSAYATTINASIDARKWIRAKLIYKSTDELFEYGFHNQEDIPDNYFDFVDEYLVKEDLKFCSEFYDDFTNNYFAYQLNSNDKYKEIKDLFKQQKTLDAIWIYFKLISTEENNLVTQINAAKMLSWELDNYPTEVDSLFRKYNLIFTETSLKKQIQNSIDVKLSSNFKTLAELSKSEDIGEIFQTISQENKNKVLYIDFWGVNCGPCITEFPNSVKLYDELKGKNIEFVYICEPTDSTAWKDAIKKYNLKGINILLTKQQRNQVFAIFKFLGIPRYMIVNRNGEFINENAERPSTNAIKGELLKLCKQ